MSEPPATAETEAPGPGQEPLWVVSGPTASGKSALAVELAERLDAEILSMDSMAVYRGMDIGTAKPGAEERRRVPHHLLDLVAPADHQHHRGPKEYELNK